MPHVPETLPPRSTPLKRAQSPPPPKHAHVAQPFLLALSRGEGPVLPPSAPHPPPDATPQSALPSHRPAQSLHPSPAPRAPKPQTLSSWATHPDRSIQTASKTLSKSYTKSAAPSLLCARP